MIVEIFFLYFIVTYATIILAHTVRGIDDVVIRRPKVGEPRISHYMKQGARLAISPVLVTFAAIQKIPDLFRWLVEPIEGGEG